MAIAEYAPPDMTEDELPIGDRTIVRVSLTGTMPLLLHNGRLANPMDPWTRELKALTSKRSKTDEDLAAMLITEARGAAYETPEGYIGLPDSNVWRAIQNAAKAYKRGKDVDRAVIYNPVHVAPILFPDGQPQLAERYLMDASHIDYRNVGIQGRTVMRSRPVITEWRTSHDFEVYVDIVMVEDLVTFVTRAGRLEGVGDHRPQYGRFTANVETVR
jgi:hypothetical protein